MIKFFVFCLTAIIGTSLFAQTGDFVPNTLIIKFSASSKFLTEWLKAGRKGEIAALRRYVGVHSAKPYLDDALLTGVRSRFANFPEGDGVQEIHEQLSRICIVHCSTNKDVHIVAKKLSKVRGIQYAEIQGRQRIEALPNDPDVSVQYHLAQIKAFEAWDELAKNLKDTTPVILAIVDTGIDYDHEDLRDVIFTNPGESGLDAQGRDKRSNGVDDDKNGKIDDWRGWDFVGADGTKEDNNPQPGNRHGTHVAGIAGATINNRIGIAGVAPYVRLMPVKIAVDNPSNEFVENGFPGILYAAVTGARVINCSWRVTTASTAELEILTAAQTLGALVIGAAGNDGQEIAYYPAAYPGTISVASVNSDDVKSGFSNYHASISLSAPGNNIYSTLPSNRYGTQLGTSMAAPLVAGIAAMTIKRFPTMTNEQITAQLLATTDNIDALNKEYLGLMGMGRINAQKALTRTNAALLRLTKHSVAENNNNGIIEAGETIELTLTLKNLLNPLQGSRIECKIQQSDQTTNPFVRLTSPLIQSGAFLASEERTIPTKLQYSVSRDVPFDYPIKILMTMFDNQGAVIGRNLLPMIVNPSYRTISANNLTLTVTSNGSLGFNDYSTNEQGVGMLYKNSSNFLFEGALLVASGSDSLSNTARSAIGARDKSFTNRTPLAVRQIANNGGISASATFSDNNGISEAGVSVEQSVYQYTRAEIANYIITSYKITNTSLRDFSRLFAGIFMDWDIGDDYEKNEAFYDEQSRVLIARNIVDASLPVVGVKLLSSPTPNIYTFDIDSSSPTLITFDDGFSRSEKWSALSGSLTRKRSTITDIASLISAGPLVLSRNQSTVVTFMLIAGKTVEEVLQTAQNSEQNLKECFMITPNPTNGDITLTCNFDEEQEVFIDIINSIGQKILTPLQGERLKGCQIFPVTMSNFPDGLYMARLRTATMTTIVPFLIAK